MLTLFPQARNTNTGRVMAEKPVITCPECTKKFKGKDDVSGKRIRCPFCSKVFVVPKAAPAPAADPKSRFADDDGDNNPYGITDLDIAPRCPNCANPMADDEAFICLFCGYNTLTRELGRTEKVVAHTGGERLLYLLPGLLATTAVFLLICWLLFFSLVLPSIVKESWAEFTDHESMRVWETVPMLSTIWALGYYAFNRLIVKPTPPAKTKD
jgi:DNA-directed RNA polymerase subunit RPC12/RpoP